MRHIISLLLENESGALSRVAGLFSARGYNIESLNVAATNDRSLSRLTLVTHGDDAIIEQIIKQLNKLIDVVKVVDLTDASYIAREMMVIKVKPNNRSDVTALLEMVDVFRASVIDIKESHYTIEVTGARDKIHSFIDLMEDFNIIEVVRSGSLGVTRGAKSLSL